MDTEGTASTQALRLGSMLVSEEHRKASVGGEERVTENMKQMRTESQPGPVQASFEDHGK